ncbi:MAG TPA: hypothetical protein VGD78_18640 [Chthoniobacterales bacterium]
MFFVEADLPNRLLVLRWVQRVRAFEVRQARKQVRDLLGEVKPGFRLLADLSRLESMDLSCAPEIGAMMDLFSEKQVGTIVRVVPDPHKDIGLNIMSRFHYGSNVRFITCEDLPTALQKLAD